MATTAQYASTPLNAAVKISVANTARDGTGTIATLYTAGANGARIDDIYICSQATTTAGVVRMWLFDGTTHYLQQEIIVTAVTPSTTVAAWATLLQNQGIVLQNGWSLKFSTEKAETFNVIATRAGTF